MTQIQMDSPQAMRRIEKAAIESGYSTTGKWITTEAGHSLALTNMPDCRLILWQDKGEWAGMLAVAVGEEGEFPLTGARLTVTEEEGLLWRPKPFHLLRDRIDEVREQVRRWDREWAAPMADKAMMRLALDFLRGGKPRKAGSVLLGALRGEVSMATVSESLSIVQLRWARSREEMLRSALIWSTVFK